jgi:hypothetical protein
MSHTDSLPRGESAMPPFWFLTRYNMSKKNLVFTSYIIKQATWVVRHDIAGLTCDSATLVLALYLRVFNRSHVELKLDVSKTNELSNNQLP